MSGLSVLTVGNMYPPHHLGGAELIWRSAVEHLRARGDRVRVLTSAYRSPDPDPTIAEDADAHRALPSYWRDHRFPRLSARERLALERSAGKMLDLQIAEFEPDVVCWWSMGGLPISLLDRPREAGIPALGVLLDDWLIYGPEVDGWQRLRRRLGPLAAPLAALTGTAGAFDLSAAARWVFMSETLSRRAAEAGVEGEDSLVIRRGIDAGEFEPATKPGWSGRLLYLGRIDPRKGIEVALRALGSLPEHRLTIVGEGDRTHLEHLHAVAAELGLADRVEFKRLTRGDVPGEVAAADALLFPVLWEEPWGLVPLEAMAAGTPVVASGRGGSGEYLSDGANSLLYAPAADERALAAAVRRLAADAALRERLRTGGFETVGRYSASAFNEGVATALGELAR